MDEETANEFEHQKNDALRQLAELGVLAKALMDVKERLIAVEYRLYKLEGIQKPDPM